MTAVRSAAVLSSSAPLSSPAVQPRRVPLEWGSIIIGIVVTAALVAGWIWRKSLPWDSETGVGYWLGIIGLSCVGVLLLYPLRKRISFLGVFGSVPAWFRLHMFLGVLGPTLILFHCRFNTGSINAQVALYCMLIVAASGVVGRFLYVRIYRGVAGRKMEARRLLSEASELRTTLNADFVEAADIAEELEDHLEFRKAGFFSTLARAVSESSRIGSAQHRMIRSIRHGARQLKSRDGKATRKRAIRLARRYGDTVRSAVQLEVFERFFALWHVVHLPLFFLMVFAAVIHVIAVHLY